jgi:hypothetical protein
VRRQTRPAPVRPPRRRAANIAGPDRAGRPGPSWLFASVFKDAQPRFVVKDSAAPWLSQFVPGLGGRRFDIVGDLRGRFGDLGKFTQPALEALRRLQEQTAALELFERRWEQDALWYLLSHLEVRHIMRLSERDRGEVEAVLLDALEGAVRDEEFAEALRLCGWIDAHVGLPALPVLSPELNQHMPEALDRAETKHLPPGD